DDLPASGGLGDLGADHLECADDLLVGVVHTDQVRHELCGQVDPGDLDVGVQCAAELGVERAAGELDHQVGHATSRHERDQRVDAALEALGRLAGQLVPARGARDRDRVEVRRLDQYVAGG